MSQSTAAADRALTVAISATVRDVDGVERVRLNAAYLRAVESAGLVPIVIPPLADASSVGAILDRVDGLVLSGGEDVDPSRYGQPPHAELGPVNCSRDETELALLAAARDRRLPTLAICRGLQVVNVALGGTLVQDLPSQRDGVADHDRDDERASRVHEVRVETPSRIGAIVGTATLEVNSIHHQAVDRPADPLRVTAVSGDGVVEAVESRDDDWWLVGVQWHPEELTDTSEAWDRRLFRAFADACRAYAATGERARTAVSSPSTSLPAAPAASASRASDGAGTAVHR